MRLFFLLIFIFLSLISFSQNLDRVSDSISTEADKLYRSEMASWYGSDIYLEREKDQTKRGGYLSYTNNNEAICIFFSKEENPKVLATITFDTSYNVKTARYDDSQRPFTQGEKDLYEIRTAALEEIRTDTLFKHFHNTSLNLIPLIDHKVKKVYALTGSNENGTMIFGNDYLLTFDNDNKTITKKQLHKNIIITNYGLGKDTNKIIGGIHTHLTETGNFITATDICTIRLYEKLADWQYYIVMSKDYVSYWNCKSDRLVILTLAAWKKISEYKDSKKKKERSD